MTKMLIAYLGIPLKCQQVTPSVYCYKNEKVLTMAESSKRLLRIFASGNRWVHLKVEIDHDSGKSCFEVDNKTLRKMHKT